MRRRRHSVNPIFETIGRAVVALINGLPGSRVPGDYDHLEWLVASLKNESADAARYFDRWVMLIDPHSHPSHAMNPIDRHFLDTEDWPQPSKRHFFSCMFCGAMDHTKKGERPCPRAVPK